MKKTIFTLIILGLAILLTATGFIVWLIVRPGKPVYNGKLSKIITQKTKIYFARPPKYPIISLDQDDRLYVYSIYSDGKGLKFEKKTDSAH